MKPLHTNATFLIVLAMAAVVWFFFYGFYQVARTPEQTTPVNTGNPDNVITGTTSY